MAKGNDVVKITSWKQLKEKKKTGFVKLEFPNDELIELEIQGLSQSVIDAINDKYDSQKPAQPTKKIANESGTGTKTIQITFGPDYDEWQAKIKTLDSLKMAELALAFLVVKPEGTLEEQIKALREDLLAGHFIQIIKAGYEISGFNIGEKIEEAKNF